MLSLYVASSWRNDRYPDVIAALQSAGHAVLDWRADDAAFSWRDLDPNWQSWSPATFRRMLGHPVAVKGFARDLAKMKQADACVLLLPCGRSAHFEAGWFWGQGKPVLILAAEGEEPELMYGGATDLLLDLDGLLSALQECAGLQRHAEAEAHPERHCPAHELVICPQCHDEHHYSRMRIADGQEMCLFCVAREDREWGVDTVEPYPQPAAPLGGWTLPEPPHNGCRPVAERVTGGWVLQWFDEDDVYAGDIEPPSAQPADTIRAGLVALGFEIWGEE